MAKGDMWSKAKGPISATICTVWEIGWQPISPTRWLANEAMAYIDGPRFAKAQILGQAAKDLERKLWRDAAHHAHGEGLEEGGRLGPTHRAKRELLEEGHLAAARAIAVA